MKIEVRVQFFLSFCCKRYMRAIVPTSDATERIMLCPERSADNASTGSAVSDRQKTAIALFVKWRSIGAQSDRVMGNTAPSNKSKTVRAIKPDGSV